MASHSLMVVSAPAEAKTLPSGLNATAQTCPVCPASLRVGVPSAASQIRTVLPSPLVASHRPFGLNEIWSVRPVVGNSVSHTFVVSPNRARIPAPKFDHIIVGYRGDMPAIRTEPDGPDIQLVIGERANLFSRVRVPNPARSALEFGPGHSSASTLHRG